MSRNNHSRVSVVCRDYQTLQEQDRYEADGLDDEVEDTRDFATRMRDQRAAEELMEERDGVNNNHSRVRKLPTMLQEHGTLFLEGFSVVVDCVGILKRVVTVRWFCRGRRE